MYIPDVYVPLEKISNTCTIILTFSCYMSCGVIGLDLAKKKHLI